MEIAMLGIAVLSLIVAGLQAHYARVQLKESKDAAQKAADESSAKIHRLGRRVRGLETRLGSALEQVQLAEQRAAAAEAKLALAAPSVVPASAEEIQKYATDPPVETLRLELERTLHSGPLLLDGTSRGVDLWRFVEVFDQMGPSFSRVSRLTRLYRRVLLSFRSTLTPEVLSRIEKLLLLTLVGIALLQTLRSEAVGGLTQRLLELFR